MILAEKFKAIEESLPKDWTDLELDLHINDIERYVDAAVILSQCNAQPFDVGKWQWRLLVANRFGHAAAGPTVHGVLHELDQAGITGELKLRELREGRYEIKEGWGRPESARAAFRTLRSI